MAKKSFKRAETGMLSVRNVSVVEMQDLLAKTRQVPTDRYIRSIRSDIKRWMTRYYPTPKTTGTVTMKVVTTVQDCIA